MLIIGNLSDISLGKTSKLRLYKELIANYLMVVKDSFTIKPIEYDYLNEKKKIYESPIPLINFFYFIGKKIFIILIIILN